MPASHPVFVSPVLAGVAAALVGSAGAAPAPVPFETNAWSADTGYYQAEDSAWWPEAMTVDDFNGDGRLDVAIANWGNFLPIAERVSVMLGSDDGRYAPATHYTTPAATYAIVSADLDGDGDIDLVSGDCGFFGDGETITVLLNDGLGVFSVEGSYDVGGTGVTEIVLADLTGDGVLDALTANYAGSQSGNTISILPGDGAGGFGSPSVFTAMTGVRTVAAGDIDNDGDLDVVAASGATLNQFTTAALFVNDGLGGLGPAQMLPSMTSGGVFYPSLRIADMDNDGDQDIIYADLKLHHAGFGSAYAVAVHRNDGDGDFPTVDKHVIAAYTGGFSSIEIADLDLDGRLDIAGTHDANENWGVLLQQPDGGFGEYLSLSAGEYPTDVKARDVDDDGDPDLLVLAHFGQTLTTFVNPGDGRFGHVRNADVGWAGAYHFDVGDIDNDGDVDIATTRGYASNGTVTVTRNNGDGSFAPPQHMDAPVYASSVKLRDLNNDGWLDLLWADKYPPYSFRWKFNLGTGAFESQTRTVANVFTCGVTLDDAIDAHDFDNDGDLDVVLMENLGCGGQVINKRLFICENDGAGGLAVVTIIENYVAPYEMMFGDVNGDGALDIVVAANTIEVFLGNGDLSFQPGVVSGGLAAKNGTLADIDGDGDLDVILTIPAQSTTGNAIGVMRNDGSGGFAPIQLTNASRSPNLSVQTAVTTGDVDDDGDLDVLVGNYSTNSMSVFLNDGTGRFAPQFHVAAADSVRDIRYADITGDGRPDFLATATFTFAGESGGSGVVILPGLDAAPPATPGDINGDGVVGPADLSALLAAWGACPDCAADLDNDGDVDASDLSILLANWST